MQVCLGIALIRVYVSMELSDQRVLFSWGIFVPKSCLAVRIGGYDNEHGDGNGALTTLYITPCDQDLLYSLSQETLPRHARAAL